MKNRSGKTDVWLSIISLIVLTIMFLFLIDVWKDIFSLIFFTTFFAISPFLYNIKYTELGLRNDIKNIIEDAFKDVEKNTYLKPEVIYEITDKINDSINNKLIEANVIELKCQLDTGEEKLGLSVEVIRKNIFRKKIGSEFFNI